MLTRKLTTKRIRFLSIFQINGLERDLYNVLKGQNQQHWTKSYE